MGINSTVVKSYVYELVTKGDVVDTVTIRAKSLKKSRIAMKQQYTRTGYTFRYKSSPS